MQHPDRRTFLAGLGAGAFAPQHLAPAAQEPAPVRDLAALTDLVRRTGRSEIVAKAIELHRGGATFRDLLGAAFLAGVHDVEPRPVGFQFHCVLMTSSAYQIAEALPAAEQLLPALFNLADLKASQAIDAQGADWTMPEAPAVDGADAATAANALRAALDAWDAPGADRAVTALARGAGLDSAFEVLWPHGVRDFTNIGHNPIFTAQAHRTLQQIGWRCGEDVLRSLVYGLLDGKPGANDATFAPNRERAGKLRADWPHGKPSASAGRELLATLRTVDPAGAAEAVIAMLGSGLALGSVFDGMRLFAIEQTWRSPGILAVHALTAFNALRYGMERSRDDATRRLLLLQAASWLVLYRDFLAGRSGYDQQKPGIETLSAAETKTTAAATFALAGKDATGAAALCLRTAADDGLSALGHELRHWLVRKVREHHDYKFAAALLEETALAEPDVAARLLAGSLGYLRTPAHDDAEVWRQARG